MACKPGTGFVRLFVLQVPEKEIEGEFVAGRKRLVRRALVVVTPTTNGLTLIARGGGISAIQLPLCATVIRNMCTHTVLCMLLNGRARIFASKNNRHLHFSVYRYAFNPNIPKGLNLCLLLNFLFAYINCIKESVTFPSLIRKNSVIWCSLFEFQSMAVKFLTIKVLLLKDWF